VPGTTATSAAAAGVGGGVGGSGGGGSVGEERRLRLDGARPQGKRVRDAVAISSLLKGGDEAAPPPAGGPSSMTGGRKAGPSAACRPPAHPRAAVRFKRIAAAAITAAETAAARSVVDCGGHPLTVRTALLLRAPHGVMLAARPGGGGGCGALNINQNRCRHTTDAVCVRLLRERRCSGSWVGHLRQEDWWRMWGTRPAPLVHEASATELPFVLSGPPRGEQ